MTEPFRNIAVIKLRNIGDVIITTPVFASLRHYYPDARITAVVNEGTEDVLIHNPHVDDILVVRRFPGLLRDAYRQFQFLRDIRRRRFDCVLELTNSDRGAFIGFVSGAPRRLGFMSDSARVLDRHLLYTDRVRPAGNRHIIRHQLLMIEHLGHTPVTDEPAIYWSDEEAAQCGSMLTREGLSRDERYAVIHPTLVTKYKEWQSGPCAALCDHIFATWNIRPVVICGGTDGERDFVRRMLQSVTSPVINLGGRLSLRSLVPLIGGSTLFVGVDSGPMHIAEAAKTPLVTLFGPSNARRWGPVGQTSMVVQKTWECVPCRKRGCDDGGWSRCLAETTVDEVVAAVETQMSRLHADDTQQQVMRDSKGRPG